MSKALAVIGIVLVLGAVIGSGAGNTDAVGISGVILVSASAIVSRLDKIRGEL